MSAEGTGRGKAESGRRKEESGKRKAEGGNGISGADLRGELPGAGACGELFSPGAGRPGAFHYCMASCMICMISGIMAWAFF